MQRKENRTIAKIAVVGAAVAVLAACGFVWRALPSSSLRSTASHDAPVAVADPAPGSPSSSVATTADETASALKAFVPRPSDPMLIEIPGKLALNHVNDEYPRAIDVLMSIGDPPGPALDALNAAEVALDAGELNAGFMMYMAIRRCQDSAIEDRQSELARSASDPENYERLLARNETALRECDGVGPAEIARGHAGLKTAAERGDIASQLYYPVVGADPYLSSGTEMLRSAEKVVEFRRDAMRFKTTAAMRGSVNAMMDLANSYRNGIITARDMQKSYLYAYAVYLLDRRPYSAESADRAAATLTAEQIRTAQQQARQFLDRCCR